MLQANKKSPMSLRHRAFISRQTVVRPSVTSAKDAAGYFVGTDYLCPRNNPPLCILGSSLVVKTSLKEQPEQACRFRADRDHRGLDPSNTLDAGKVPMVHKVDQILHVIKKNSAPFENPWTHGVSTSTYSTDSHIFHPIPDLIPDQCSGHSLPSLCTPRLASSQSEPMAGRNRTSQSPPQPKPKNKVAAHGARKVAGPPGPTARILESRKAHVFPTRAAARHQ
jgi:hypothetical protein